jgi:hypothetical protein
MRHFNCTYGDQKFIIKFSRLANQRIIETGMAGEAIFGSVVAGIKQISEMESDAQFIIVDKEAMSTTVCGICDVDDIKLVTVITVVELSHTLIRDGQKVINL